MLTGLQRSYPYSSIMFRFLYEIDMHSGGKKLKKIWHWVIAEIKQDYASNEWSASPQHILKNLIL